MSWSVLRTQLSVHDPSQVCLANFVGYGDVFALSSVFVLMDIWDRRIIFTVLLSQWWTLFAEFLSFL